MAVVSHVTPYSPHVWLRYSLERPTPVYFKGKESDEVLKQFQQVCRVCQ
jgi:hypothetical protein